MTFWDHLDELRGVLIKMIVVVVTAMIVLFIFMPDIFDTVIMAPCRSDFFLYRLSGGVAAVIPGFPDFSSQEADIKLINIQLASQFFIHISTSFWLALVLCFPVLLYLTWIFVSPALYPHEKKGVGMAFLLGSGLFFLGIAVGYFIVFPVTLRFLAGYHVSALVPNQISLDSYMDTFLMLIFIMGVVFEMPLLAWMLGKMYVLRRNFFSTYRKHAIVTLLILAAIITPTGDPFTLLVVFLPIYLLYEASAYLVPKASPQQD